MSFDAWLYVRKVSTKIPPGLDEFSPKLVEEYIEIHHWNNAIFIHNFLFQKFNECYPFNGQLIKLNKVYLRDLHKICIDIIANPDSAPEKLQGLTMNPYNKCVLNDTISLIVKIIARSDLDEIYYKATW